MSILSYINPFTLLITLAALAVVLVLVFVSKYAYAWLRGALQQWLASLLNQAVPANGPAPLPPQPDPVQYRSLSGLSWLIAGSHRSVAQIVGLEMSIATLAALVLSVASVIAGTVLIAYQTSQNVPISVGAGLIALVLAVAIETISLFALKTIRRASERIDLAEQSYHEETLRLMHEQFEQDKQDFAASVQITKLSKEEEESMKRARNLQLQQRKAFESQRRKLMNQQTRTDRRTRAFAFPFAVIGVIMSATAGGLFWHMLLASLPFIANVAISTLFALVVSVTFVQGELQKRIKDDSIEEALQENRMQSVMLKQQSQDMVLELVVDSIATLKQDQSTAVELGGTIKDVLKGTMRALTTEITAGLVTVTEVQGDVAQPQTALIEETTSASKPKKVPDWISHEGLSVIALRYPLLHQKLSSWRTSGRVTISIVSLVDTLNCSKRLVENRIKDGTLQVSSHNHNLVRISSVIDWLQSAEALVPKSKRAKGSDETATVVAEEDEASEEIAPDTEKIIVLPSAAQSANTHPGITLLDGSANENDKLSITLAAMAVNPEITDADLAQLLGLKKAASARFWKVKAASMLATEQAR